MTLKWPLWGRGQQTFHKGLDSQSSRLFVGHVVSVITAQLRHCNGEAAGAIGKMRHSCVTIKLYLEIGSVLCLLTSVVGEIYIFYWGIIDI